MRLAVLAAAAGLVAAAPAAAQAPGRTALAPEEILLEVSGTGVVQSPADRIVVKVMARSEGATAAKARAANEALIGRLVQAARGVGIPESAIQTGAGAPGFIGNEAGVGWTIDAPRAQPGASVVDIIDIQLSDPARFPALRGALEDAGSAQVIGPTYTLVDDRPARAEAKAKALADAQVQAEIYARAAKLRLGRLLRISERAAGGMEDPLAMQEMLKAMAGQTTRPGIIETRVRIAVDYALLPIR
jgi:uncharacterized protein YggE